MMEVPRLLTWRTRPRPLSSLMTEVSCSWPRKERWWRGEALTDASYLGIGYIAAIDWSPYTGCVVTHDADAAVRLVSIKAKDFATTRAIVKLTGAVQVGADNNL